MSKMSKTQKVLLFIKTTREIVIVDIAEFSMTTPEKLPYFLDRKESSTKNHLTLDGTFTAKGLMQCLFEYRKKKGKKAWKKYWKKRLLKI